MTRVMVVALIICVLTAAGLGAALKRQLEITGEQKQKIAVQQLAIDAAEKLRKDGELAIAERDRQVAAGRRLISDLRAKMATMEVEYAKHLEWRDKPLSVTFIKFMCEFTNSDSPTCLPFANPAARPAAAEVVGGDERGS